MEDVAGDVRHLGSDLTQFLICSLAARTCTRRRWRQWRSRTKCRNRTGTEFIPWRRTRSVGPVFLSRTENWWTWTFAYCWTELVRQPDPQPLPDRVRQRRDQARHHADALRRRAQAHRRADDAARRHQHLHRRRSVHGQVAVPQTGASLASVLQFSFRFRSRGSAVFISGSISFFTFYSFLFSFNWNELEPVSPN